MSLTIFIKNANVKSSKAAFKVKEEQTLYTNGSLWIIDTLEAPHTMHIIETERFFCAFSYPLILEDQIKKTLDTAGSINSLRISILSIEQNPMFGVLVDKTTNDFIVFNDICGYARCYMSRGHRYGIVISDNPLVIPKYLAGPWHRNYKNMILLAAVGWMPGTGTLVSKIEMLEPETIIRGNTDFFASDCIIKECGYVHIFEKAKLYATDELSYIDARDKMVEAVIGLAYASDSVTASITGGRDTRMVAAILLQTLENISFMTTNNFDNETKIVKELLQPHLNDTITLTIRNPHEPSSSQKEFDPDSADILFNATGGFFEPGTIGGAAARYLTLKGAGRPIISGIAGEMVHGYYYPPDVLRLAVGEMIGTLSNRFTSWAFNRFDCESILYGVFESEYHKFKQLAYKSGHQMGDYKYFDYVYFAHRVRRWSSLSLERDVVAPLSIPDFIAYSFAQNYDDVADMKIPKRIAGTFDPKWAEIPYYKGQRDPKNQAPTHRDPLAGLKHCQGSELIEFVYGKNWRNHIEMLVMSYPSRARQLIARILAVNSAEKWLGKYCD